MYSPRIRDSLIPQLYQLARKQKIPMTQVVNGIIDEHLHNHKRPEDDQE